MIPRRFASVMQLVRVFALSCSTLAAVAGSVQAQEYPNRPIRLVVGYPPGGSNDIVARIVAPKLAAALGTQVIVDNRAGASGTIGADHVAKSPPDGYTLLVSSASPIVIAPHTLPKAPFDVTRDFQAINTVGSMPEAIAVGPAVPVRSLRELIELSKTRDVTLSSSGNGGLPHLTIELLKEASKGRIVHVPYKGAGPAVTDTLAGHVNGVVMDLPALYAFIQDGRLRALAVTSEKRVDFLRDVPTAQEEGLPSFQAVNWIGVLAPAGTPKAVVDKVNAALVKIVADAEVREQLTKAAVVPTIGANPEAFQQFLRAENTRWAKVVKDSGAKSD